MKTLLLLTKLDILQMARGSLLFFLVPVGGLLALEFWWFSRNIGASYLSLVYLAEVLTFALMFSAGVVLVEKRSGVLSSLSVTPASSAAWLGAKLLSMVVVFSVLTVIAYAPVKGEIHATLIAGILAALIFYLLIGIALSLVVDKITDFFLVLSVLTFPTVLAFYAQLTAFDPLWLRVSPFHSVVNVLSVEGIDSTSRRFLLDISLMVMWIALLWFSVLNLYRRKISARFGR